MIFHDDSAHADGLGGAGLIVGIHRAPDAVGGLMDVEVDGAFEVQFAIQRRRSGRRDQQQTRAGP
jgi:hypothetical protein